MIPQIRQWHEGAEIEFGIWDGIPNALYHGGPGISKSGLDDISTSPLYYRTVRDNPRPSTEALEIGSAFHCIVLEPDVFKREYMVMPEGAPRRPDARQYTAKKPSPETLYAIGWWDNFERSNEGRKVLSNKDDPAKGIWGRDTWSMIHYMRDAIMAHPEARIYLDPSAGKPELSVYTSLQPYGASGARRLAKCRPDFWNMDHGLLVDLKSSNDATLSGFQRSVHDWRYDVQEAWYRDLCTEAGLFNTAMVFVVVEKQPPYHVGVYQIETGWVREGRAKYERDLRVYHECMEAGEWPSIPDFTRVLPQPGYAKWNPIS